MNSLTPDKLLEKSSFNNPAILRIILNDETEENKMRAYESSLINSLDWIQHKVKFKSDCNYNKIVFQARHKSENNDYYCGHILPDHLCEFKLENCK